MPRFVILDHDHPFPHLDFMIESGDRLRTWRLRETPAPERTIAAEAIGDHRKDYLDYTGPVSGGRGRVERWDAGAFTLVVESTDEVQLVLSGDRVKGAVVLRQLEGDSWEWRLNES
jgi:hypothetical protein